MDSLETTFTNYQISFPRDMGHVLLRNMLIGIPTLLIALILSNPVYCIGFYLVVNGIIKVLRLIPSDIVDKGLDKVHRFIRNDRPPIDIAYNKLKNYRQYPDVASYISSYRKKLYNYCPVFGVCHLCMAIPFNCCYSLIYPFLNKNP